MGICTLAFPSYLLPLPSSLASGEVNLCLSLRHPKAQPRHLHRDPFLAAPPSGIRLESFSVDAPFPCLSLSFAQLRCHIHAPPIEQHSNHSTEGKMAGKKRKLTKVEKASYKRVCPPHCFVNWRIKHGADLTMLGEDRIL